MPLPGLLLQATQPDLGRLLRADALSLARQHRGPLRGGRGGPDPGEDARLDRGGRRGRPDLRARGLRL